MNYKFENIIKRMVLPCAFFVLCITPNAYAKDKAVNVKIDARAQFVETVFQGDVPKMQTLWLDKAIKKDVKKILRHDYGGLRARYWQNGDQTVWVLNEVGKYKPITIGVSIKGGAIAKLQVLEYRESHGWEVKKEFFTRQFIGARLSEKWRLDQNVDGISGATLSVRALKKIARLALYFDSQITKPTRASNL